MVHWWLLRLQKQSRLLCDRTILHSEEQLWTNTEDTEAPHLHEISHTTSSTQQRFMQLHKRLQNPGVLIIIKAAKTKQTTLWSNNFAFRGAVMNYRWRYGSATHIYTKHRTLLAPHSNFICKFMKKFNTLVYWSLLRLQKQNRLLSHRTILHSEEQLWNKTEGTEAPQLHETTHTTSSTEQRYIHLFKKNSYIGVLIIIKAAKKQTTLWSSNFAFRGAVMNYLWRYGSATQIYTKHRTLLAPHSNVICKFMKKFNTLVYWSLLRLQKQNRLLCDRTILHSEEQLWNKTEGTEAPQLHETTHTTSSTEQRYIHLFKKIHTLVYWSLLRLQKTDYSVIEQFCISRSSYELFVKIRKRDTHLHETSHTTSSTQQRFMQLHKRLQNPGVLIIIKAAKTKQTTLWSNNFAFRGAVMNYRWRYGSATHIYTKHRTLLAPHSNFICKFMKKFNTLVYWSLLRLQKQNRLLCHRTILHSEEQLWNKTEGTEAPQLHETTHTTSSTEQRYIHLFKKIHTLVYWSLLRLQKNRLLCDRAILHFEEQLWTICEDTEARHRSTQNIAHY